MKIRLFISNNVETLIMALLWLLFLIFPVMIFQNDDSIVWNDVFRMWQSVLPFLLFFIINHFFLVPIFLFKKKILQYAFSAFLLILVFALSTSLIEQNKRGRNNPPEGMFDRPPIERLEENNFRGPGMGPPPGPRNRPLSFPPIINTIIISFLILGFDTGMRMMMRSSKIEKEKILLEKENVQNQLAFLQNQVSPHFFMNTLNNIHALIDIDTEDAKEAIIRLSKLMRHLLYDSQNELVPLGKELEFIRSYIDLMKLRVTDRVEIILNYPEPVPPKMIPALLFTSFVENAFKYGISYEKNSSIKIDFALEDDMLIFSVLNNYFNRTVNNEASGIGLENSKKRLDLLYGKHYLLKIEDKNELFRVLLKIPL